MELFKRDTLVFVRHGKLDEAERVALYNKYVISGILPDKLWRNMLRIALYTLNRIRGDIGWPKGLPADTLQDCLQEGVMGAAAALRDYDPTKGTLLTWIMASSSLAMREYAWEQVKGGIHTRNPVWMDSIDHSEHNDEVNEDDWIAELSYSDPPEGYRVPDGMPEGSQEVHREVTKQMGMLSKKEAETIHNSLDSRIPKTSASRQKAYRVRKRLARS